MNQIISRKKICFVLLLLVSTQSYGSRVYPAPSLWRAMQHSTSLKVALCVGAGALLCFTAYKCCSWITRSWRLQTDRSMLDQAQRMVRQNLGGYARILQDLEPHLQQGRNDLPDGLAENLTQVICPANQSGSCNAVTNAYINRLGENIAALDQQYNALERRIADSQIPADIVAGRNQVLAAASRLRPVHAYLGNVEPFIVMQALRTRHAEEIAQMPGGNIQVAPWPVVVSAVGRYNRRVNDGQPYLRYHDDVGAGLAVVERVGNNLNRAARQAYESLGAIVTTIFGSQQYRDDVAARRLAIQRAQELAIQQAQATAAAEQARAAQTRARAEQQQAEAATARERERRRERQRRYGFGFVDVVDAIAHPL